MSSAMSSLQRDGDATLLTTSKRWIKQPNQALLFSQPCRSLHVRRASMEEYSLLWHPVSAGVVCGFGRVGEREREREAEACCAVASPALNAEKMGRFACDCWCDEGWFIVLAGHVPFLCLCLGICIIYQDFIVMLLWFCHNYILVLSYFLIVYHRLVMIHDCIYYLLSLLIIIQPSHGPWPSHTPHVFEIDPGCSSDSWFSLPVKSIQCCVCDLFRPIFFPFLSLPTSLIIKGGRRMHQICTNAGWSHRERSRSLFFGLSSGFFTSTHADEETGHC